MQAAIMPDRPARRGAAGASAAPGPLLEVRRLNAAYGESRVLHGVDFHVNEGELVTLLGRNGAGKSTTLKAVMGVLPQRSGTIRLRGREIGRLRSDRIARLGMVWCPEDRGIFASLTVEENLMLPPRLAEGGMEVERIYAMFPNLRERRNSPGTRLSGGEQQMLALARILRTGARLLLLDEITEGLAPVIVEQIGRTIAELKAAGYTILLVEQNFRFALSLADRHYVMEHGRIVDELDAAAAASETERLARHLGV